MYKTYDGRKPNDIPATTTVYNDVSSTVAPFAQSASPTSAVAAPFTTTNTMPPLESWPHPGEHHVMSAAVMGAAGAIATLAFLCLMGALVFCACRRVRRQRNANRKAILGREMIKTNATPDTRAYIRPPSSTPPPSISSPSSASLPSARHDEPPMLLSTTIDQSYYTGIDTSDMVSVTDQQRNSAGEAGYAPSITEPPPPYRPRSIPPFSRDSSVRIPSGRPPSYGPRLSVRSQREVIRSPFDDPEEESPISETNEIPQSATSRTRDMEEMSDVSELSYQQEPVVARSSL
jgi:hypothetical protein